MISRRELARELRRKAYRDAKARRAQDPRFLAMKEAAKQRRRELYQVAKEKKKAAAAGTERKALERRNRDEPRSEGASRKELVEVPGIREPELMSARGRDRSIKVSSAKASARAALAQVLGTLREVREQREATEQTAEQQPSSELIERVRLVSERDGAANDRS